MREAASEEVVEASPPLADFAFPVATVKADVKHENLNPTC
jgi:hypothetical protein